MDAVIDRERSRATEPGALFIAAILLATVLNPLNSSTISVALPVLLGQFHAGTQDLVWLISAYYFGSALAQPVFGKLGDQFGYRPFAYLGLALLAMPTLLAPFSPSFAWLVAWRVAQAIGTSMLYPSAIGLVRQHRDHDLGRILGWIGMAVGVALAVGPSLAGAILALVGWRGIFWLNAPLIALIAILLHRGLRGHPERTDAMRPAAAIDAAGVGLLATSLGLLLAASALPHDPVAPWLFLGGMAVVPWLWTVEKRAKAPAFDVSLLRRRPFALAGVITVLANFVMYVVLYGLPSLLETDRGMSPLASGLLLLGFAGVLVIASPFAGRLAQGRLRRVPLLWAGALLLLGSLILIEAIAAPLVVLVGALALIGVSFALSNVLLQKLTLENAPTASAGSASGLYTLLRYLGTMGSSVVIAAALGRGPGSATLLFSVAAAAALGSLLVSLVVKDAKSAV